MSRALLVVGLLVVACATQPSSTPATARDDATAAAWKALAEGRVEHAEALFREAGDRAPDSSLRGLLYVAALRNDRQGVMELQRAALAREASLELLVSALEAGLHVKPTPASTWDALERAEAAPGHGRYDRDLREARAFRALEQDGEQPQCVAGCERAEPTPLVIIANSFPVVLASVEGAEPAPMIVDESTTLTIVTPAFAKRVGLRAVPGTAFEIPTESGAMTVELAHARIDVAGTTLDRIPVLLSDLPYPGIAGILSPHSLPMRWATVDLRAMTLTLSNAPAAPLGDDVDLPLWSLHEKPHVVASVADGAPRLFGLLFSSCDTLLVQDDAASQAVPGQSRRSLPFRIASFTWNDRQPTFRARPAVLGMRDPIEPGGYLGLDFSLGRRVVIDRDLRRITLSAQNVLATWPFGSRASFEVDVEGHHATVDEEVVAREGQRVRLRIRVRGERDERFEVQVHDSWGARQAWAASRSAERAWVSNGDWWTEIPVDELRARLAPYALPDVEIRATWPAVRVVNATLDGAHLSCIEATLLANSNDGEVTLRRVQCGMPTWPVMSLEYVDALGTTRFRHQRVGFRRADTP